MADAPICFIPVDQDITQPNGPTMPAIPLATDYNSMMAAVNAMRQAMMAITGQRAQNNRNQPKTGRWVEQSRSVSTVRVKNPKDPEQYVDVERINALVLRDTVTGELWTWKR